MPHYFGAITRRVTHPRCVIVTYQYSSPPPPSKVLAPEPITITQSVKKPPIFQGGSCFYHASNSFILISYIDAW